MTIEEAVALLRSQGWTCIAPVDPNDAIPVPEVGQVWHSPKPRVEPRTIVYIGPHRTYPSDDKCVGFTTPTHPPHERWGPLTLNSKAWTAWVKKSGARPA